MALFGETQNCIKNKQNQMLHRMIVLMKQIPNEFAKTQCCEVNLEMSRWHDSIMALHDFLLVGGWGAQRPPSKIQTVPF